MNGDARTLLQPGKVIEFDYPRHNFNGVRTGMERRLLRIDAVRDVTKQPLELETIETNPLLRRSRLLVIGRDLRKRAEREFYDGSMQAVREVEPPPAAPEGADGFQVWIVEETEEFAGLATLNPAGVYTDDIAEAKAWADAFNNRELVEPVDAWAVIRVSPK